MYVEVEEESALYECKMLVLQIRATLTLQSNFGNDRSTSVKTSVLSSKICISKYNWNGSEDIWRVYSFNA